MVPTIIYSVLDNFKIAFLFLVSMRTAEEDRNYLRRKGQKKHQEGKEYWEGRKDEEVPRGQDQLER